MTRNFCTSTLSSFPRLIHMAPGSKVRAVGDGRSGGKMLMQRRMAARKTPYDRPTPPPENPNWLTGLIVPARMVASGAGKLLSSFWNPETWSSPSSSSDSGSEIGVEDDSDDEVPSDGVIELNKNNNNSSWMIKSFSKELQLTVRKRETMRLIEQLLMLENFSREECNRLVEIIKSRVVDCSMKEVVDAGLHEIPSGRTDDATPDICSQAIMEAKKWLEEKKVGSSSKSNLDHGIRVFNSDVNQHVTDSEAGSPVDMAKSYMHARPPWASPYIKHNELRTPSPKRTDLFKEGTPYSKKDSLSVGSWNIEEEIRRLRSKATEVMLSTHRSTKIDFALFSPECITTQDSLAADKTIGVMKLHESSSLTVPKSADKYVNLPAGMNTHDLSISALERANEVSPTEALPSHPVLLVPEQNKDLEFIEMVEGEGAASKSPHAAGPEVKSNQYMVTDVTEFKGEPTPDGSASSRFNLSAGLEKEQNSRQSDEGNLNLGRSACDKLADIIPVEGTCELLTETSIEVPIANETIGIVNGCQSSSSMDYDEFSHEQTQLSMKPSLVTKRGSTIQKQLGKKPSSYSRKGRGRGK